MKIRLGFVSNSSSSSFVLGFSKKPTCVDDVEKEMFPQGRDCHIKAAYFDEVFHTWEVARMVFDDIEAKKGLRIKTLKAFTKHCAAGYFDGYPETDWSLERKSAVFEREFQRIQNKRIYDAEKTHPKEYAKFRQLRDNEEQEHRRQVDEAAKKFADKQWPKLKDKKFIYALEYGDSHGIRVNGVLEHGNAWDDIPHTTISHH